MDGNDIENKAGSAQSTEFSPDERERILKNLQGSKPRKYTPEFKLMVLMAATHGSVIAAAKEHHVSRQQIYYWRWRTGLISFGTTKRTLSKKTLIRTTKKALGKKSGVSETWVGVHSQNDTQPQVDTAPIDPVFLDFSCTRGLLCGHYMEYQHLSWGQAFEKAEAEALRQVRAALTGKMVEQLPNGQSPVEVFRRARADLCAHYMEWEDISWGRAFEKADAEAFHLALTYKPSQIESSVPSAAGTNQPPKNVQAKLGL